MVWLCGKGLFSRGVWLLILLQPSSISWVLGRLCTKSESGETGRLGNFFPKTVKHFLSAACRQLDRIGWSKQIRNMKNSVVPIDSAFSSMEDVRPSGGVVESSSFEESPNSIPLHPLGVRPLGNQYTATSIARKFIGTFQAVPDEIIAIILEVFESHDLRLLGATCKFLYAFTRSDDLWKTLFIE